MDDSAHAVDETKMDVAMMEDGPEVMGEDVPMASAPSVALSGEAKMGLKRVDDNTSTKPEDDDIKTVVEYEVKFSSTGVTDGGLVFGAAISIDEDGKGAAGSNGVNAASAYIGGADGTWKLQFGNNDPGIDKVGNVGLADADNISGMAKTLEPVTWGDDKEQVYLPSHITAGAITQVPASAAGGKGIAKIPPGGISPLFSTTTYEITGYFTASGDSGVYDPLPSDKPISRIKQKKGGVTYTAVKDGTGLTFTPSGTDMPAPPPGRSAMALTGTIDSFSYALTAGEAGEDAWSAGVKYDPGVFYVSAGADSNDVLAVGAGGTLAGFTGKATYVKQDGETYWGWISAYHAAGTTLDVAMTKQEMVNEMEAMGLSVSRDIGSGSNVTLAYSRLTDEGIKGPFVGTKQWELDFTYDLGGGASFYAGIEQADKSMFEHYTIVSNGADKAPTYTPVVKKSKVTTLEAGITMTF